MPNPPAFFITNEAPNPATNQLAQAIAALALGAPDTILIVNQDASRAPLGTPMYMVSAHTADFAEANATATSVVAGLACDFQGIPPGNRGNLQNNGVMSLSHGGQWDIVTGQMGGLTPGTVYYLSDSIAGNIQTTKPTATGSVIVPIGIALDNLTLLLYGPAVSIILL